jgi:class 3 adenylate cyclase/tetratricopeptide (TPR) repeat protein/ABC-type cobalamin transport system ATPase subunit
MSELEPTSADRAPRSLRATVLFADILGFTATSTALGPERAYFAVTGLLNLMDGVARHYGGSVDKFMGDALLALFGHPMPSKHPEVAALSASLEMVELAEQYRREVPDASGLEVVIGVNTGPVVVADPSGPAIREFDVLGDAVNAAARIKSRTPPGHVYCGGETLRGAPEAFEFRSLGSVAVKGKSQPIEICDVERATGLWSDSGLETGVYVGRQKESARLRELVQAVADGAGARVDITGPRGIGKTRLLAELSRWCETAGLQVIRGSGREEALDVRLVTELGGSDDAPVESAVAPAAARAPLALIVDDADHAGASWLARLPGPDALPGVLLAIAEREPKASRGDFEPMPLEPLDDTESRQLLDDLDLPVALSPESQALVLERSAGIPESLIFAAHAEPALRSSEQVDHDAAGRQQGERRRATILFADITGFTALTERMGAERAYPVIAKSLALLDEIARKHGGNVEKYLGDCVMALFGIPHAIEDAPRAAVNAAIEMRRRLREFAQESPDAAGLDLHSGIHTGLGIAGDISGPLLREFAVMGDPVTIADALKDVAPAGTIYIGEESRRFLDSVFECRSVGKVQLARIDEPLPVFEVLSDREQLGRRRVGQDRRVFAPLVGRTQEMEAMRHRLTRLKAGEGGIISLVAEPGLGKSRLLAELAATTEAEGLSWQEGASLSIGRRAGFHSFADLIRRWAQIDDQSDEASIWAKLHDLATDLLPNEAAELVPFLGVVIGHRLPDEAGERISRLESDALEKLVLSALTRLVRAAGEASPTVIVMDDVHWADNSSLSMLEALARLATEGPVLFINVFRPGYESTSGQLRDAVSERFPEHYLEIHLGPLDASAARELLQSLFLPDDLPYQTRRRIEERSQGNPFYIEEVVRALLDEGAVEVVDGGFRATERITDFVLPGSIQEVISVRIDSLPRRQRELVQSASVIGGVFHLDVLAELFPGADPSDEIASLMAAEFLVESDRLPGEEYAFKHPLLQEVTYDGLLEARRTQLHRTVGLAIEARLEDSIPGYLGMLAFHFSKGQDAERAEEYLFRAGDEAARAAAPSEALEFFEEASSLYIEMHGEDGDPAKLIELERNIANALYYRGRFVEAIDHYNRALRRLGDPVDRSTFAASLHAVADLAPNRAHLSVPGRLAVRDPSDRERTVMELRYARAEATVTAEPTRHVLNGLETLARLQRLDPRSVPRSGKMYAGGVGLFAYGGISFSVSRRLADVAEQIVAEQDATDRLYERVMRFTGRALEGDWSSDHEVDPALIETGLQEGQPWGPTTYLGILGEKQIRRGDLADARASIDQIGRIWDLYQYDLAKANFFYLGALLPLEERRLEEAVKAAQAYHDENPEDLLNLLALSARAKAETLMGDLHKADETLGRAATLYARCSPTPPFHAASYQMSRLRRDLESLRLARRNADRSAERAARRACAGSSRAALRASRSVSWWRPEAHRLAASCAFESGSMRAGWKLLARSLAISEELGASVEHARAQSLAVRVDRYARSGRGSAEPPDWVDAGRFQQQASHVFESLNLKFDFARLDE